MKTLTLLHRYKSNAHPTQPPPAAQWERLVYHAADLIRMAEELRHTRRNPKERRGETDNQMELPL